MTKSTEAISLVSTLFLRGASFIRPDSPPKLHFLGLRSFPTIFLIVTPRLPALGHKHMAQEIQYSRVRAGSFSLDIGTH